MAEKIVKIIKGEKRKTIVLPIIVRIKVVPYLKSTLFSGKEPEGCESGGQDLFHWVIIEAKTAKQIIPLPPARKFPIRPA